MSKAGVMSTIAAVGEEAARLVPILLDLPKKLRVGVAREEL